MEEVEIGEKPNANIKEIELIRDDIKYKTQIEINKQYLNIFLYESNIIKHKGHIHIINIQFQLGILNYTINDVFDEIYKLDNNKFNLIKDNKYNLQIEFKILNKKRNIDIELYENINNYNDNEYIKTINELKEKIKEKDKIIKSLQEELNKYKNINKDDNYDNFKIKDKEPKNILKYHTDCVRCSTVLKDGRFVTGSNDNSIIIYNNKTFEPDLIIKEHKDIVNCVVQLSSSELVSSSNDKTIKLYNINENKYNVIQTLTYHEDWVGKIIELKNKQLVSCSGDKSIKFYSKDNNEYKKDYSISTNRENGPIIQTKDNEICYYEYKDTICFYDFIKKNIIQKINSISVTYYIHDSFLMISKDLLIIAGQNKISIVNVNSYNITKAIQLENLGWILATCMLNKDTILTSDFNKNIIQWKFENDNLKLISKKENAHDNMIYTLSKLDNGLILSGSADCSIKIW